MKQYLDLIQSARDASNDGFFRYSDGILAFRGTETFADVMADAYVVKIDYVVPVVNLPGGRVHGGFLRRWEEIRGAVLASVGLGPRKLTITGHSLGGAMAALAAIEYAVEGWDVDVVTFGAPRLGDDDFARLLNHILPMYRRFENRGDPIPYMPTYANGWRHAGKSRTVGSLLNFFRLPHTRHHALAAYQNAVATGGPKK